jgi:thiamine biosynthesis lipoprotein
MIKRCQPLLGTFVEIKIEEENSAGYLAVEEAFEEIQEIHNLMSFFDVKSQVSLLNREAHQRLIAVDPQLFEVLTLAQKISKVSDGVFDITLHRSANNSSSADIELLENFRVKFHKPLQIDLGGIAKGYAVDCAARALENYGINSYIINAGGDLRVGKSGQIISIRNPKNLGTAICETEICEGALATSAGYFSYQEIDGKKVYPIFQPRSGAIEYRDESVSVFAKNCIIADALTKVVTILKEKSAEILAQFDAQAMLVSPSNQVTFINQ